MPHKYYAVANGRRTGVYDTWAECKFQTDGYAKNDFKSFPSEAQAQNYIQQRSESSQSSSTTSKGK